MNPPIVYIFNHNVYLRNLFGFERDARSGLDLSNFDINTLNTSTNNDYIPMISFNKLRYEYGTFLYHCIKCNDYIAQMKHFLDFLSFSYSARIGNRLVYTDKGVSKTCYVGYGYILDDKYNFMFLTAFRSRILPTNVGNREYELDMSNSEIAKGDVKIFITNSFMKDYRKLYNMVNKNILQPYIESGCELSIVDSDIIKDTVYGNEFERNSNFETLEDRLSFIELLRNTIL